MACLCSTTNENANVCASCRAGGEVNIVPSIEEQVKNAIRAAAGDNRVCGEEGNIFWLDNVIERLGPNAVDWSADNWQELCDWVCDYQSWLVN